MINHLLEIAAQAGGGDVIGAVVEKGVQGGFGLALLYLVRDGLNKIDTTIREGAARTESALNALTAELRAERNDRNGNHSTEGTRYHS